MKKYNRVINIIDKSFKLIKDIKTDDIKNKEYKDLDSCYVRPSKIKREIYDSWYGTLFWGCDKVVKYGICSYNCNIFSLNAIVEIENQKYYIYITKTRQEIYKIVD